MFISETQTFRLVLRNINNSRTEAVSKEIILKGSSANPANAKKIWAKIKSSSNSRRTYTGSGN